MGYTIRAIAKDGGVHVAASDSFHSASAFAQAVVRGGNSNFVTAGVWQGMRCLCKWGEKTTVRPINMDRNLDFTRG